MRAYTCTPNKQTNQLHYECLITGTFPLEGTSSELTSTTCLTSSWLAVSMASSLIFFNRASFADTQDENSENLKAYKNITAKEANCQEGETHLYFEFTEMEPGLTKSMAPSGNFTLKTKASVRLIT